MDRSTMPQVAMDGIHSCKVDTKLKLYTCKDVDIGRRLYISAPITRKIGPRNTEIINPGGPAPEV